MLELHLGGEPILFARISWYCGVNYWRPSDPGTGASEEGRSRSAIPLEAFTAFGRRGHGDEEEEEGGEREDSDT